MNGPPRNTSAGRSRREGVPELAPAPIPEALLERASPLRGRLRQYRLTRPHAFPCASCGRRKIARLVAEVDGEAARRLCNACYGLALASDPSGNTIPASKR